MATELGENCGMSPRSVLAFGLTFLIPSSTARANVVALPVPIDRVCSVPADPGWTTPEKFVWEHVCIGDEADFNTGTDYGGDVDPKTAGDLPESRILRPAFLEMILLDKKYRQALTRIGVHIVGARFADPIKLRGAQLEHDLILRRCAVDKGGDFGGLRSSYSIQLSDSKVDHELDMGMLQVNQLNLSGSNITGDLTMYGVRIAGTLYMRDAEFGGVDLGDGRISGALSLTGSKIKGDLDMAGLQVGSNVVLGRGAQYAKTIDFFFGKVGGNLDLAGGTFTHTVDLTGTQIGGFCAWGQRAMVWLIGPGVPSLHCAM